MFALVVAITGVVVVVLKTAEKGVQVQRGDQPVQEVIGEHVIQVADVQQENVIEVVQVVEVLRNQVLQADQVVLTTEQKNVEKGELAQSIRLKTTEFTCMHWRCWRC